jgi:hypothetical protein
MQWVESAHGSGRLIVPYKLLQTANGNDNDTDENDTSEDRLCGF